MDKFARKLIDLLKKFEAADYRIYKLCGWYDSTIYMVNEKKESVIRGLETSSSLLFGWFNNNFMKANSDKSHLIMSCAEATTAVIDGLPIVSSKTEVLLGITIDHELKFDDHVNR